jgi:small subunit ribosomal protein S17
MVVKNTPIKNNMKRVLEGVVVSDKMDKTIVVMVEKIKIHPKYNKRYASAKKYQVHDETNQYKIDDKVKFIECRPLSKNKRWRVLNK